MKFLYGGYEGNEEKYKTDCDKAVDMLRAVGFNEDVLKSEIEHSKRDYGEEFFWTVLQHPEDLQRWSKEHDLSKVSDARNFVLYCTEFS